MRSRLVLLLCLPLVACSSAKPRSSGSGGAGGNETGAAGQTSGAGQSGGEAGQNGGAGSVQSGSAGADAGAGGGGVAGSGVAGSGAAGNGAAGTDGGAAGSGAGGSIAVPDGGTFLPAGYTGTPFKTLTIPGIIYGADYDKGFSGVGFCRVGAANPPTPATCGTPKFNDWCCGTGKGCDERGQATCPIYRQDSTDPTKNDNAGLSHMNGGEPDNWAASGPTWVVGPEDRKSVV